MNYLAHAVLSFGDAGVMVGNLVSDFVKGKKKFDYPAIIQKGIALHRAIDIYTDTHEATRIAKNIFRTEYRLYSGAIVDVIYDHFLANDEREFTESSLLDFSKLVYTNLEKHQQWLPERFAGMFPYMRNHNWLFNYRMAWGIERSLGGLARRAQYMADSSRAFQLFEEHYQRLEDCYRQFWTDVKPYALREYELLTGRGTGNI